MSGDCNAHLSLRRSGGGGGRGSGRGSGSGRGRVDGFHLLRIDHGQIGRPSEEGGPDLLQLSPCLLQRLQAAAALLLLPQRPHRPGQMRRRIGRRRCGRTLTHTHT